MHRPSIRRFGVGTLLALVASILAFSLAAPAHADDNAPPVASAGDAQYVRSGTFVTLDGTGSTDPDGGPDALTYAWTQSGGPTVALTGADTATPTFTAPTYYCNPLTDFTFDLTVGDGAATSSASVTVTVTKLTSFNHPLGDYNGDGTADPALFNPSTGVWQIRCQGIFKWGSPGDIAVPGDYNGDGTTDVAVYTPKTSPGGVLTWVGNEGLWRIKNKPAFYFAGLQNDIPVAADYFGDGSAHAALFRPSTGEWRIRPLDAPQIGATNALVITFGKAGDVPIPGDYDHDGQVDLALYRPSTGQWIIGHGLSPVLPTILKPNFPTGVKPVVADFDGDGKTDIVAIDPATGKWYRTGSAMVPVAYGQAGDVGFAGDFDGTGSASKGRFRRSSLAVIDGEAPFYFGADGFQPVNAWFASAISTGGG